MNFKSVYKLILLILPFLSFLTSCNKENEEPQNQEGKRNFFKDFSTRKLKNEKVC